MCLTIDNVKTRAFKQKYTGPNGNKKIKVYKILAVQTLEGGTKQLITPQTKQLITGGVWEAQGEDDYKSSYSIERGIIHCFTNIDACIRQFGAWREAMKNVYGYGCIIVTGYAHTNDFVAEGTIGDCGFKKIFIPESEVKRALACV